MKVLITDFDQSMAFPVSKMLKVLSCYPEIDIVVDTRQTTPGGPRPHPGSVYWKTTPGKEQLANAESPPAPAPEGGELAQRGLDLARAVMTPATAWSTVVEAANRLVRDHAHG